MDTGSHLLFGVTLAGLAMVDPTVAGNTALAQAVLVGTVIGSHAPDLDTVTRLKSYSAYIRHHRGITHSIPALFAWPLVLALPIAALFGVTEYWGHLYVSIFAAVFFHVFLDLFNAYGVQCFRPFTTKWFHHDVLPLFDPFLFGLHLAATALWFLGGPTPGSYSSSCTSRLLSISESAGCNIIRRFDAYTGSSIRKGSAT